MIKSKEERIANAVAKVNGKELLDKIAGYIENDTYKFCNRGFDSNTRKESLVFSDMSGDFNFSPDDPLVTPTVYISLDSRNNKLVDSITYEFDDGLDSHILALSDDEINNLPKKYDLDYHTFSVVTKEDFSRFSEQISNRLDYFLSSNRPLPETGGLTDETETQYE